LLNGSLPLVVFLLRDRRENFLYPGVSRVSLALGQQVLLEPWLLAQQKTKMVLLQQALLVLRPLVFLWRCPAYLLLAQLEMLALLTLLQLPERKLLAQ
jgi:hypothetical protein